jgi:hypothetical protein
MKLLNFQITKTQIILSLMLCLIIVIIISIVPRRENFDMTGLVLNVAPEWFQKQEYHLEDWLVNVYPDHIVPSCLPYSIENKYGDLGLINYYGSPYQFWLF